jgi:excisionase family DNA binding protein
MEKLISVQEAAELLGLRPATIYKYIMRRVLPHVKPGGPRSKGRVLFSPSKLQTWVERHSVEPTTAVVR